MHLNDPFVALLLITALAVTVPILLSRVRRVRLPIVVGEIIAGIIIGKSGFNLVEPSATLDFLAEFGFAYLMFLSGLEIDYSLLTEMPWDGEKGRSLKERFTQPLPLAVAILVLTIGLAFGSSLIMQQFDLVQSPFLMGLILSTTSLGVVAPVLKERRLLDEEYGQSLLVTATLADFVTLILLTVVIAARSGDALELDLLLIPVLLITFLIVARLGRFFVRVPFLQNLIEDLSHATAQIRVRGAFALMVAWVVLAEALGVELILGAFLAGSLISLFTGQEHTLAHDKLDAIGYGFFIPIFFIMVGVEFELGTIFSSTRALLLLPVLVGVSYFVKIVPSLLLGIRYPLRDTFAGGVLLSSRLSLIIAASAIALEVGAITPAIETDIVLDAILTTAFSPMIFNRLLAPRLEEEERKGLIVVGSDKLTEMLARRLYINNEDITIVCQDGERLYEMEKTGLRVVEGPANDPETLSKAGAETAASMIVISNDTEYLWDTCHVARRHFKIPVVVADVADMEIIPQLQEMGVRVVQPALATAMALEGALRFPTAFDMLTNKEDNLEVQETIFYNPTYAGQPLRRLQLPGNAVVFSIKRDNTVMVPRGDTLLELGDTVAVIGNPDAVKDAMSILSS